MKKIKSQFTENEQSRLKKMSLNVNATVYALWIAWMVVAPLLAPWTANATCVNVSRNGTCPYTPTGININGHYSTTAICDTNDCGVTCNVTISEILNGPLNKSYSCGYHVNHSASWDSWSWDSWSWDSGWDSGWDGWG